ncbi:hypothetical protein BKA62DRAFT_675159 [Auriculariales sp. MPI-PUGE-AT-0066]|nr:hypothetical protein BKA62DRAFT_675159 [Auriculariales sp. MPI-PUGE-AT-0066]
MPQTLDEREAAEVEELCQTEPHTGEPTAAEAMQNAFQAPEPDDAELRDLGYLDERSSDSDMSDETESDTGFLEDPSSGSELSSAADSDSDETGSVVNRESNLSSSGSGIRSASPAVEPASSILQFSGPLWRPRNPVEHTHLVHTIFNGCVMTGLCDCTSGLSAHGMPYAFSDRQLFNLWYLVNKKQAQNETDTNYRRRRAGAWVRMENSALQHGYHWRMMCFLHAWWFSHLYYALRSARSRAELNDFVVKVREAYGFEMFVDVEKLAEFGVPRL